MQTISGAKPARLRAALNVIQFSKIDGRVALAAGLLLFVGGMAIALWRATGRLLLPRSILIVATAIVVVAVSGVSGQITLVIAFAGILAVAIIEQRANPLIKTVP